MDCVFDNPYISVNEKLLLAANLAVFQSSVTKWIELVHKFIFLQALMIPVVHNFCKINLVIRHENITSIIIFSTVLLKHYIAVISKDETLEIYQRLTKIFLKGIILMDAIIINQVLKKLTTVEQFTFPKTITTINLLKDVKCDVIVEAAEVYDNALELYFAKLGILIHLTYLTWRARKFINYKTELIVATYDAEWNIVYEKFKNILKMLMLRCDSVSVFNKEELYVIYFNNFRKLMKTTVPCIAIVRSFTK